MSASGGIFPAEDVFKHFVYPVPPYDSRVMNMSPEAYLQGLIDQGLIKDKHDQNARRVQAVMNQRVYVEGQFNHNGTFVIHLVESIPPPTEAPRQRWPIRDVAILKEGMYCLLLLEHMPGKIEFAGKPSEAWVQHKLNERTVWRAVFGRNRGRPEGRKTVPTKADKDRLRKVEETVKQLSHTQTSRPEIKEVMMLMGWHRDPKRMRELLALFDLPSWPEYVRQVLNQL